MPKYPWKLFFYCEVAPSQGGETPLLISARVCRLLEQKLEASPSPVRPLAGRGSRSAPPWRYACVSGSSVSSIARAARGSSGLGATPGLAVEHVGGL